MYIAERHLKNETLSTLHIALRELILCSNLHYKSTGQEGLLHVRYSTVITMRVMTSSFELEFSSFDCAINQSPGTV